jgi:hypothetical protein
LGSSWDLNPSVTEGLTKQMKGTKNVKNVTSHTVNFNCLGTALIIDLCIKLLPRKKAMVDVGRFM